jgi:hypothetical protein
MRRQTGQPTVGHNITLTLTFPVVEVEVNLWLTVSQPVCLGAWIPSGSHDQISFISLMIAGFLIWAPSLRRGWVHHLLVQLPLGLARAATLGSRTHGHILLSLLRLPQSGGPVIPLGTGFPFSCPYDSQGCSGVILTCLHTDSLTFPAMLVEYLFPSRGLVLFRV